MAKSPTRRSRRKGSPFNKQEEIWLISRCAFLTPTQLRRAYIKEYKGRKAHHTAPKAMAFLRLVDRFRETGGVTGRCGEKESSAVTAENIARVEDYFTTNTKSHIREASVDLDLSVTTVWRILWIQLKWKPYKPIRVTMLTEKNKKDRMDFCRWFLAQEEGFEQRVIKSDEKWFQLHYTVPPT